MLLDDLVGVIQTLKERISSHRDVLSANEYRTRVSLIDPLLCALGWDTADPTLVTVEYAPDIGFKSDEQVDYALFQDGQPIILIEAKRANKNLDNRKHFRQLFDYFAMMPSAKIGILTNGIQYRCYSDLKNENVMDSKPFLNVDITSLSPRDEEILECFSKGKLDLENAIRLSEEEEKDLKNFCVTNHETDPAGVENKVTFAVSASLLRTPVPIISAVPEHGWTSLDVVEPFTRMPLPSSIKLPDGKVVVVPNWKWVFVEVAEHLIRHGILTPDRCPIIPLKTFGVHTKQYHKSATRQLSNGLYWRCSGGAPSVVRACKMLMNTLRQDPAQVWVKTG